MNATGRFHDKVAIVTGASRGIGEAVARELVAAGARGVVITGRKKDRLATVARDIGVEHVSPVVGNVGDDDHAGEVVAAALSRFDRCDLLVNNAATNFVSGMMTDVDMSAIDKIWHVNQRAPLVFARAAWHGWMSEHGGSIVNIGSVGGLLPSPGLGAYGVAKAALNQLTKQLAFELAPGVRVNAIAAGVVMTSFSEPLWTVDMDRVAGIHPLRRLGTPEEIAKIVTFLASDEASWLTGIVLPVDGGITGASAWHPADWAPVIA